MGLSEPVHLVSEPVTGSCTKDGCTNGAAEVQVPLLPDPSTGTELARTFGSVRYVDNRALAERSDASTQEQRK